MARKHRISQNFLRSPRIALMLVGHSNIRKRDFTLDIGAGSGVFTFALSKKSAQVLAIEFDSETFKKLKNNYLPLLIKLKKYSIIMRLEMLVNTFRLLLINTYLEFELK